MQPLATAYKAESGLCDTRAEVTSLTDMREQLRAMGDSANEMLREELLPVREVSVSNCLKQLDSSDSYVYHLCAISEFAQAACGTRDVHLQRSAAVCPAARVLLNVLQQQIAASDTLAKQLEPLVARAQDNACRELDVWEKRLGSGMKADAVLRNLFDVDKSIASGPSAATGPRLAQQQQSASLALSNPSRFR